MPKRRFVWFFHDPNYQKKFIHFLETLHGETMNEKLNAFWEEFLAPKNPEEYGITSNLDNYMTCPLVARTVKIRELPCMEDHNPDFLCRNPACFEKLKKLIPDTWWKK